MNKKLEGFLNRILTGEELTVVMVSSIERECYGIWDKIEESRLNENDATKNYAKFTFNKLAWHLRQLKERYGHLQIMVENENDFERVRILESKCRLLRDVCSTMEDLQGSILEYLIAIYPEEFSQHLSTLKELHPFSPVHLAYRNKKG